MNLNIMLSLTIAAILLYSTSYSIPYYEIFLARFTSADILTSEIMPRSEILLSRQHMLECCCD